MISGNLEADFETSSSCWVPFVFNYGFWGDVSRKSWPSTLIYQKLHLHHLVASWLACIIHWFHGWDSKRLANICHQTHQILKNPQVPQKTAAENWLEHSCCLTLPNSEKPFKGDIPNEYLCRGTIPRVPPFSLWLTIPRYWRGLVGFWSQDLWLGEGYAGAVVGEMGKTCRFSVVFLMFDYDSFVCLSNSPEI